MSNYHILKSHAKGHEIEVAFHITIPNTNNFAGVNLRTALKNQLEKESEEGTITSAYPLIESTELTKVQSGEVYEHFEVVKVDGDLTKTQKNSAIASRWTALNTSIVSKVETQFDFWGYSSSS